MCCNGRPGGYNGSSIKNATADETYDGKSLTMKDIFERQSRLLKAKEKVLNLRQNDDKVSEGKGEKGCCFDFYL